MNDLEISRRFEDVKEASTELLDTAREIRGDAFAMVAARLFEVMQIVELVSRMAASMDPEAGTRCVSTCLGLTASLSEYLLEQLPQDQHAEATRLAEQMADRLSDLHDAMGRTA